jgi:hypothetical protein
MVKAKWNKRTHMCISVDGALRRHTTERSMEKDFKNVIKFNGRTLVTGREIMEFFKYQRAMGREVLPMGDCNNFDYKTGCKGHRYKEK